MLALKAAWEVTAGLIPGTPMPEASMRWLYSSADYQNDGGTQVGLQLSTSDYARKAAEAHAYASDLERGGYNWVKLEYLWL